MIIQLKLTSSQAELIRNELECSLKEVKWDSGLPFPTLITLEINTKDFDNHVD